MGISSKIVWTLGGVLLMSSAFAGQKEGEITPSPTFGKPSMSEVSRRLECVEKKLDQISEVKMNDALGGKNPPGFGCPGHIGLFTDISFLYWKAFNNGWVVANERRSPHHTDSGAVYQNTKPQIMDFDWSPGVRVGFGYNSTYDAWTVQGIYTWIRLEGERDITAKEFGTVAGVTMGIQPNTAYTFGSSPGVFKTLDSEWRLNHNVADLQFSRGLFITKALVLEPMLGVRFASLDQSMRARFGENTDAGLTQYYKYHISNDYWGIGPRIGIDGKWILPHNVGFTGLITGSLLYGKTTIDQFTYSTAAHTVEPFELSGTNSSKEYTIAPNLQLALGLDWGMSLNKDKMYFGVRLDWEFNYWWNHAHFDTYRQIQFPIEMQGITLKTDLRF